MEKLKKLLLERNGVVFVDHKTLSLQNNHVVYAIQAQLAQYGFAMTTRLIHALTTVDDKQLIEIEKMLLSTAKEMIGAHVKHVPLYRNFPHDVTTDTVALWWKRFTALVAQDWLNEMEPVKCHILSCGHIVHEEWFDGANYGACPICERRVDLDSTFFKKSKAREPLNEYAKIRLIDLGTNLDVEVQRVFTSLIERKIVLSPVDLEIFKTILEFYPGEGRAHMIVSNVPVKENVAILCVMMKSFDLIKTATDMLRTLVYANGGDISLVKNTKFGKINRTDRKRILGVLDSFKVENLTEDLLRYKAQWKRLGEILHPFEFKKRYKNVTTAFAVIRETEMNEQLSAVVTENLSKSIVRKTSIKKEDVSIKLKYKNWNSKFNNCVDKDDWKELLKLLEQRPGEFSRKLDFVLRSAPSSFSTDIFNIFKKSVDKMSTPILCTLMPYLQYRSNHKELDRIFMPKGVITKAHVISDKRELLGNVDHYVMCIENELIRRSKKENNKCKVGFVDSSLDQIIVPFNERNAAKALINIPRGSRVKFENTKTLRSFIHWVEPAGNRTDLDSTFIFYNSKWDGVGECSYNNRQFSTAAYHSGDLTSAPGPLGATEYVDLHIEQLKKAGIKYVAATVFSYNGVPFHELPVAFAGIMHRDEHKKGEIFEPKTVEQKFSLTGNSACIVPFVIDLEACELFWTDIHLKERAGYQASWSHAKTLNGQLKSLVEYYSSNVRPNMLQIACMQLASNCETVFIRTNKETRGFEKKNMSDHEFYSSLMEYTILKESERGRSFEEKDRETEIDLAYLYKDDEVKLKDNAMVYTLYRNHTNGNINYTQASDVISF